MATQTDFRVKKGLIVGTSDTANPESGTFTYDSDFNTVDLTLDANVNARLAQDHYFYVKAGATITKGDVVYASGAVGNSGKIEVTPYIANNTIEETLVLGVAAEDMATGAFGYVAQFGSIRGLDASGGLTTGGESWTNGAILYASPTYAGELTLTKPSAPNQDIPIAFVVSNNASTGTIAVRASRLGYHMDEVHDVEITSIADNDLLVYNNSNSRWENSKTIGDLTLTGELNGPATFYIDPSPHDPDTDGDTNGLVVIRGDLQVDGTTTTVNSTTVEVADKNIVLGANATANSQNDGAGITILRPESVTNVTFNWDHAANSLQASKPLTVAITGSYITTAQPDLALVNLSQGAKLTLRGLSPTISFDKTGSNTRAKLLLDNGAMSWYDGELDVEGDQLMTLSSTGSLAIGAHEPSMKLHVIDAGVTDDAWNDLAGFAPEITGDDFAESSLFIETYPSTTSVPNRRVAITPKTTAGVAVPLILNRAGSNVGIGEESPVAKLDIYNDQDYADLYLTNDGYDCSITMFSHRDVSSHNTILGFASRGTQASPATLQDDDYMLRIIGRGYNTSDATYNPSTEIAFVVDGEPNSASDPSDMPGRIEFKTAADGTDSENIRMVIKNNGKVGIGQVGPFAQVHSEINSATGAGAGPSGALWLRNRNQTDGNAATIFWGDDESAAMGAINLMHDSYSNNYGSIDIDTRGTSGYNTKLTITSGGDIIAKNTGLDTYVHRKITNAGSGSATRYIVINKTDIGDAFKFVGKIVGSRGTGVSASNWAMLDVGFDLNNSGQYPKFGVNYQSGYHASLYGHMTAQWVTIDWDDGNGSATWWALQLSSNSGSNWPADLDNMAFSGYVHNVANDSGEIIVIEDATQTITNITPLGRGQTTVFNHSYVGISTNNPQTALHINESNPEIRIQPTADTDTSRIRFRNAADDSSRGQIAYDHTNQKLVLNVTGDHVWLTNTGKVGIGTDSPTNKLSIQSGISSSSTAVIDILQNTNGAQKQAASIGILVDNGGESTNAAGMFFQTASGGSLSERMRLTSSGGLELGYGGAARQQADNQAFSIITPASGGGQGIALKRLDSNNDQQLGEISWSNNTQDGQANIRVKTAGAVNSTDMHFDVNNAGTLVTALSIDGSAGGNVGIGVSEPDSTLHVNGSVKKALVIASTDNPIYSAADADNYFTYTPEADLSYLTWDFTTDERIKFHSRPSYGNSGYIRVGKGLNAHILPEGWTGIVSAYMYGWSGNFASTVSMQTKPLSSSTWTTRFSTNDNGSSEYSQTGSWTVSTPLTEPYAVRFYLAQSSGVGTSSDRCYVKDITITNLVDDYKNVNQEFSHHNGDVSVGGRIVIGTYTDSSDQSDYGISVYRKGTASSPATFSFTDSAYDYTALYGQGPSSYIQRGDLLNGSYGRIVVGDSNTHNFAIIDISYDSGLSPMRLDGRGNLWLGHNRSLSTTDSTRSYSLKAAGKVYAAQGFNNNSVREYAQFLSGIGNSSSYTFDVPIQATGAGYTVYYECMYNHFGNTSYGSWRSGMFSFRSLSNSTYYDDVIINQGNSNSGSWSVTMVDAGTSAPKMRFTKSAGTYGGSGDGHIFVRGGLIE